MLEIIHLWDQGIVLEFNDSIVGYIKTCPLWLTILQNDIREQIDIENQDDFENDWKKHLNLTYTTDFSLNLVRINLNNKNLDNADLENANLENAHLRGTFLRNAILHKANLSGAILENAHLPNANLQNAILTGAVLKRADLTGADLQGVDLRNADLQEVVLNGINLKWAQLEMSIWHIDDARRMRSKFMTGYFEHIIIGDSRSKRLMSRSEFFKEFE